MKKNLHRQVKGILEDKSDKLNLISGQLGITINGAKTVQVSGREGYVWVRLRGSQSELIQAYNASVSPIYDLPVLVTRQGNKYSVYGRDIERYENWGDTPYLPKHGTQHSFAPELGLGGDVTWVYSKQIMPMLAMPSGTSGAAQGVISSFTYRDYDGAWKLIGDAGTDNILLAKPTNNQARMMTLYWDLDSSTSAMVTGSLFDASITGTSYIVPYLPEITNSRHLPIAGIRLVSGTSIIGWDNIYDLRQLFATAANAGSGGEAHWTSGSAGLYSITTRWGTNDSKGVEGLSHGLGTLAFGTASHAEGVNTIASGSYSHAEGEENLAAGYASLAAGGFNSVAGDYSASLAGYNHTISGSYSSVISGDSIPAHEDRVAYTDRFNIKRLYSGTAIANVGIDSRGFLVTGTVGGGSSNPPTTGSIIIRNESTTQGSATILDFVGANIDASISGTVARIFVTGSAGGDSYWQAGSAGTGSVRPVLGGNDATKNYAISVNLFNNAAGLASLAAGGNNSVSGSYSNVHGYLNNVLGDASSIIAGQTNRLIGTNSSIISGNGITGSADNTGYTDFFNVKSLFGGSPVIDIGIDTSGNLVTGSSYSGWISIPETWTRTGDHTFTVSGDLTSKYRKGTKVKYNDGSVDYGVIQSSSYSAPNTTVTLITNSNYAMAAATITGRYISYIENPEGFPYWFNYTPTYSASGSMTFTSVTTDHAIYRVSGGEVVFKHRAYGTLGGTAISVYHT